MTALRGMETLRPGVAAGTQRPCRGSCSAGYRSKRARSASGTRSTYSRWRCRYALTNGQYGSTATPRSRSSASASPTSRDPRPLPSAASCDLGVREGVGVALEPVGGEARLLLPHPDLEAVRRRVVPDGRLVGVGRGRRSSVGRQAGVDLVRPRRARRRRRAPRRRTGPLSTASASAERAPVLQCSTTCLSCGSSASASPERMLALRDQHRAGDRHDLVLVRLADVDQQEVRRPRRSSPSGP